jgi:3-oxoacyl-[acyl-carrier protein] reductase
MIDLADETAIVTGAGRGIGAAIAGKLAAYRCKVVVNYHQSAEKAEAVVAEIRRAGGQAIAFKADVTDENQVNAMIQAAASEWGNPTLLINNASSGMIHKKATKTDWKDFQFCFETAVKSAYNCSRAVIPVMTQNRRGRIVNIITQYSFGTPPMALATYVTAKYALAGFSKSLAVELAPFGVTVNMVSPGLTETDLVKGLPDAFKQAIARQTPMKRNTEANDVANAVLFLASDLAGFITGVNLPVCGGNVM